MPNTLRHAIAENCSEHFDLIDEDQSGDLDAKEVETLLAAMGINGPERQQIIVSSFDGCTRTNHMKVTDAITQVLSGTDESKLHVMLGRVALFGKVFRWLDFDGDGTLSLPEIIRMMELLNIDLKLAADLMAFLDTDDSGEITWQEFVRGICTDDFSSLFPEITLEALVELPSSLQSNKVISREEESQVIAELPAIEKSLYWMLSLMYGRNRKSRRSKEASSDDFSLDLTEIPLRGKEPQARASEAGEASKESCKEMQARMRRESQEKHLRKEGEKREEKHERQEFSAHEMQLRSLPRAWVVADIPCIVRKEAKNPMAVRPAVVHPKFPDAELQVVEMPEDWRSEISRFPSLASRTTSPLQVANLPCIVRKEARNPVAVRSAVVHPKLDLWVSDTPKPTSPAPKMQLEPEKDTEKAGKEPGKLRRISTNSYGAAAAAAAAVSSAFNDLASGLASAFGIPSKDSHVKKEMSVAAAASVIKSMDVKVTKAHVLSERKRRSLWRTRYAAVSTGALAGIGAAFLAQVLNDFTSTIVDEEEDFVMWNVLAGSFSLLWSLAEMVVCCIAALVATVRMTRICGILLVPMDKERAMLAGSLARSALELGHPKVRTFGIDPYKRANKCLLLFYALIYMGSRGVTKFIIKLIVKKAAPRTLLKVTEFAPLAVEVFINVVFNSVTVNYAMNEVMICSLGPSATVEVTSQLIKAHRRSKNVEEPLSDELKLLALRAVGVSITYKMQLHPNSRFLLNHVVELFADQTFVKRAKEDYGHSCGVQRTKSRVSQRSHRSTQSKQRRRCCGCRSSPASADPTETLHEELADLGLDEEDLFFDGLTGLNHRDALFACSMLVLALMLDGRIGRQDWAFIQRAAGSVCPPLEAKWSETVHLTNTYCSGRQMNADMFHRIFETSKGTDASASCCDYFSDAMRTVSDYTNCC